VTKGRNDYDGTSSGATSRASAPAPALSVPAAARLKVKSVVLKIPHLDAVSARRDMDVSFHAGKGIEKHQNQYGKKNGTHHEYEPYGPQNGAGKQKHRVSSGQQQPQLSASKSKLVEELDLRVDDPRTIDDTLINGIAGKASPSRGGSKGDSKKVRPDNVSSESSHR